MLNTYENVLKTFLAVCSNKDNVETNTDVRVDFNKIFNNLDVQCITHRLCSQIALDKPNEIVTHHELNKQLVLFDSILLMI